MYRKYRLHDINNLVLPRNFNDVIELFPVGPIQLNRTNTTIAEQENILPSLYPVKKGGVGRPENCAQNQRVAILVPFRDREWQLSIFLRHIHPLLVRQQMDYRVFLIEQVSDSSSWK